jgi:putative tryptophan/tyrosine transport system substrate-binding protein
MILDLRFWILDWGRTRMKAISSARVSDSCSDNRKSKIQNPKWLGLSVIAFVLVVGGVVEAQQAGKVARIGYLSAQSASAEASRLDGFREALRDLGYEEGKTILVEYRFADGKFDRLRGLAAELVRLKVDTIVTGGSPGTRAAQQATRTIPLIMTLVGDPDEFVESLAKPGGNITGLTQISPQLSGKRLELLKEAFPKISRVAVFVDTAVTAQQMSQNLQETQLAAETLGIKVQPLEIRSANPDLDSAFRTVTSGRANALSILAGPVLFLHRKRVVGPATKSRLPAIYPHIEFVDDGGVLFYGPDFLDLFRRAAVYVDKILKGAKPANLPVEQPTKFELVINLKAAKQIGLTIPPNVLARADRVIR